MSTPRFVPHPLVRGGHMQTIAGRYLPGGRVHLPSTEHRIELGDGDQLLVLDSRPATWAAGDRAALLVHGLAGCARSPYVVRVAARLWADGVRVVRMNLRGAGDGFGLARGTYHAGRTGDLRAVAAWMAGEAPGSPLALVGFSLGANLALKLAAEAAADPVPGLDAVLAANPPLDLSACCQHLRRLGGRAYDRNFIRLLLADVRRLHDHFPDLGPVDLGPVRSVYDFDDRYTAPRNGFAGAEDYYARSSAGPLLPKIEVPGLIVHAEDDPFIPASVFRGLAIPPRLALELIPHGGHLGYLSLKPWEGGRRWLDVRLVNWLREHWRARDRAPGAARPAGAA